MPKKILNIPEHKTVASTPSTPDVGYSKLYVKSDGNWYSLDSSGNEILISAGSSSLSFRHDLQDPYSYCGSAFAGKFQLGKQPVIKLPPSIHNIKGQVKNNVQYKCMDRA